MLTKFKNVDLKWHSQRRIGIFYSIRWIIHTKSIQILRYLSCSQGSHIVSSFDGKWPLTSTGFKRIHALTMWTARNTYELQPSSTVICYVCRVFILRSLLKSIDVWPPLTSIRWLYLQSWIFTPNMKLNNEVFLDLSCLQGLQTFTSTDPQKIFPFTDKI